MSALLTFQGVSKAFPTGGLFSRGVTWAIKDFSLELHSGQKIGLQGPSGSGKSTLALLAAGFYRPTSGIIKWQGEDTAEWSSRRWKTARSDLQLLFQDPLIMLNPDRTLHQNLAESVQIHASNLTETDIMTALSLRHLADRKPLSFSGGELRRASLARVLLAQPKVLIADEPTVGLDIHLKADILDIIQQQFSASSALLLISHDQATLRYATDTIVSLENHSR